MARRILRRVAAWICATCGVQQAPSDAPPVECVICLDERQYLPAGGQRWTTLDQLHERGHRSDVRELEPDLLGVGFEPPVGIGQRSLIVRTSEGGLLWDPTGYVDDAAISRTREFTDVRFIAASHPHFYGVMGEWSAAFGGAPVLIPAADAQWVQRRDAARETWSGRREVLPGVTLVQCGGHFAGSAVVHWANGAEGRGALLTGDTIGVVADRRFVTFMRSYPNQIPLGEAAVRRIVDVLQPFQFDRIYGGWWDSVVPHDGKSAVQRSADRYISWISGAADANA